MNYTDIKSLKPIDHEGPLDLLSLGAGVQSSALVLMAMKGALTGYSRPQAAIFSDTQAEPAGVYEWLEWLKGQASFPIHTVTAGSLEKDATEVRVSKKTGNHYVRGLIPAFVYKNSGGRALMGRKCTSEYKVRRIIAASRALVGRERMNVWRRKHKVALKAISEAKSAKLPIPLDAWEECQSDPLVRSWIGISTDEAQRMKNSQEAWALNCWPLIDNNVSRQDCIAWFRDNDLPEPPRSACVFCPFHSDSEWIRLRDEEPEEFQRAIDFDRKIREASSQQTGTAAFKDGGQPFLHSSGIPLDQVTFKQAKGYQQVDMFGNECEGLCGV